MPKQIKQCLVSTHASTSRIYFFLQYPFLSHNALKHCVAEREKEPTMPPKVQDFLSVAKQAEQLRKDGNNYFKKQRFGAAIDAYTEVFFFFSGLLVSASCHVCSFCCFSCLLIYLFSRSTSRRLHCAPMFRSIGPTVLSVISSAGFEFGTLPCFVLPLHFSFHYYC